MNSGHWWRWALKATVGILAVVGIYAISQVQPISDYLDQIWKFFNSPSMKSSITRSQINRGINFWNDTGPRKIVAKAPGLWRVSHNKQDWSDGPDLASVLFSVADMDVVELSPGTYKLEKLVINRPLLIKGTGPKADDVIIEVKQKSEINLFNAKIKKVEFQALTLKTIGGAIYNDAFLTILDTQVGLYKTNFQSTGHEFFAHLSRSSKILGRECEFSSGDQFDTLFLEGKSELDLDNCHFKGHKVAIATHISNYEGAISLSNSDIVNSRAHGLMIYGGQLKLEGVELHNGQGGIYLGNKSEANLKLVLLDGFTVNGMEVTDGASAHLNDVSISADQTAILGLKAGSSIKGTLVDLNGGQRGLHLREGAIANLTKSSIKRSTIAGILLERQSSLTLNESTLELAAGSCIEAKDSMATLTTVTLSGCLFGLNLNQKCLIKYKHLNFAGNKEKIHNNFNSSKVQELP